MSRSWHWTDDAVHLHSFWNVTQNHKRQCASPFQVVYFVFFRLIISFFYLPLKSEVLISVYPFWKIQPVQDYFVSQYFFFSRIHLTDEMSIFSKQKMCLNIYLNLTVPVTHSAFPRHSFVCGGPPTQSLIQSSSQSLICHNFLSVQDVQIERIRVIQTNKDIKMPLSCPTEASRCQGAEWSAAWRTALYLTVMAATIVSQRVRQWQHALSRPRSLSSLSGLAEDNI